MRATQLLRHIAGGGQVGGRIAELPAGLADVVGEGEPVERVRGAAPGGVDAVLDVSGRGEIPDSVDLAGGSGS
ncbi:hypothetical protein ACFW93_38880 [Streptomyces canus]|uniref:hypothetical protein n=1 Tax=Streptomyces canus TaxID=58343 RepID=UPI0036841614